jgi:hypothetical protein
MKGDPFVRRDPQSLAEAPVILDHFTVRHL